MEPVKKFIVACVGTGVVLIGVAGCFLPVIPGTVLILVGLTLMGKEALVLGPVKRWLEKQRAEKSAKPK